MLWNVHLYLSNWYIRLYCIGPSTLVLYGRCIGKAFHRVKKKGKNIFYGFHNNNPLFCSRSTFSTHKAFVQMLWKSTLSSTMVSHIGLGSLSLSTMGSSLCRINIMVWHLFIGELRIFSCKITNPKANITIKSQQLYHGFD